jgi:uncharacterized repeat protein (TIGR03803 family)
MTPAGTVTVLHAFGDGTDGAYPFASLIQATNGNFYGTTIDGGGAFNDGAVFKMTPAGILGGGLAQASTSPLALSGTFERLAILANVSALLLYFGCVGAAWRLRARAGETFYARLRLGGPVPWLAGLVIAWLLTGVKRGEWLGIGVSLLLATLLYVGVRAPPIPGSSPS